MPKYLVRAGYTAQGAEGLLSDGGTGRVEAVRRVVASCGGTLEWLAFAFGEEDLYCVIELPDEESMAAISMTVRASGALQSSVVQLLTPEQIDAAARLTVDFRAPGA
ncbi:GYD domain-containing protein [Kitasatospora sp. NPDC048540]|uniref:GYD domain-containing protein n=1 Tax=unclassified Kitasatospora TaxID=2633591 RepID=UPI00053B6007|nr:GYD domain-containing protein [Kitasatospora sp. MBT63]